MSNTNENVNVTDGTAEQVVSTFKPHQERVFVESMELSIKILALSKFITSSELFKNLSDADQGLLNLQLSFMKSYRDILKCRISLF